MVLVSNEWLSKGDAVQKCTTGTTESSANETGILATTTTVTTTAASASASVVVGGTSVETTEATNLEAVASAALGVGETNTTPTASTTVALQPSESALADQLNLATSNSIAAVIAPGPGSGSGLVSTKGSVTFARSSTSSCNKRKNSNTDKFGKQQYQQRKGDNKNIEDQITNQSDQDQESFEILTERSLRDQIDNNQNSRNFTSSDQTLFNTFDTITKAFRGTDNNSSFNISSHDLSLAFKTINIDNFCNTTTGVGAGIVGGSSNSGGIGSGSNLGNTLSAIAATGALSSGAIPSNSGLPTGASAKRQATISLGEGFSSLAAPTSTVTSTVTSITRDLSSGGAGASFAGGGGGGSIYFTNSLSSLGMGVATNNMQTQQQTILANSKGFSSSLSNLSTPATPNNNSMMNNNTLNITFNSSSNGTNNNTLMNNSTAGSSTNFSNTTDNNNNQAKIILICETNSHPFQTRTISLTPNIECKVGRLIAKTKANDTNAIFDCKVLSRNHAVLWYTDDGKFWVKDTKSSNGTFINDNKLGNDAAELHFGDIVKFGVDVYENTRQESHGCIIACVKLFLPDGREAISIDGHSSRSTYTTESRISFEEMHRLNMYMQEAAQREKGLKTKLCSIQNVLDSTRKNSALCWQAMINEDQLIHRINSLEKKLQIMEKNVPESALRNEVLKLIDDKNTYQITAKEALRKVYQERCDALQMLAKVESAYATAENECALLRDEILATKQTMQAIHTRLINMEAEYNEYKDEINRQSIEAKAQQEDLIKSLKEQLKERQFECDNLQKNVVQLQNIIASSSNLSNKAKTKDENCEDDEMLEKQAIEKLDDAIGSYMDFGENDADEDDDEDDDIDENFANDELDALDNIERAIQEAENYNGDNKKKKKSRQDKDMKQKVIRKSTVMKWLKNSDLNKEKGSVDIIKAMFNDNDDPNAEENANDLENLDFEHNDDNKNESFGAGAKNNFSCGYESANEYNVKYKNFKLIIENVAVRLERFVDEMIEEANQRKNYESNFDEKYLNEIQEEIVGEYGGGSGGIANEFQYDKDGEDVKLQTSTEEKTIHNINDNDEVQDYLDKVDVENADDEFVDETANKGSKLKDLKQKQTRTILTKQSESFIQLKKGLDSLREAYIELGTALRPIYNSSEQKLNKFDKQFTLKPIGDDGNSEDFNIQTDNYIEVSAPVLKENQTQTQLQNDATARSAKSYQSGRFSCASLSESENEASNNEANRNASPEQPSKDKDREDIHKQCEQEFRAMQEQIEEMGTRLQKTETDANHSLEIMQIECDTYKMKLNEMLKTIEKLSDEKQELQEALTKNNINIVPGSEANSKAGLNKLSTNGSDKNKAIPKVPTAASNSSVKLEGGCSSGIESDMVSGGMTNSSISDLYSSQSDSKFEAEMAEDRMAAMALEREEELIAFKERLEKEQQVNHNLLIQLETYKKKQSAQVQHVLVRNIVPLAVVAIAALVFFAMQYF